MITKATKNPIQTTARFAAFLYLLIAVIAGFTYFYVPSQLIVPGDAAATASNIQASGSLFRLGIGAELVIFLSEIVLSVLLYFIFKPVSKTLSLIAAVSRLAMTAVHALNLLNHLIALLLLSGAAYLTVFEPAQLNTFAMLFLDAHGIGYTIGIVFFALSTGTLGYLIYKSGFLPKALGGLFLVASLGYFIDSFSLLLNPSWKDTPVLIAMTIAIAEIAFPLWLLIKGVNTEKWEKRALESAELEPHRSGRDGGFEPAPIGQLIADPQPRK